MTLKKLAVSTAIATTLMSVSASSQASALAQSIVNLTNLTVSQGGITLQRTDFSSFNATNSGDVKASVNGTTHTDQFGPIDPALDPTGSVGHDMYQTVNPVIGYSDNAFSPVVGAPPVNGTFAVGDQLEQGAPITGIVDGSGNTISTPAHLGNAAIVSLENAGAGTSTSNNGLESQFTFSGISGVLDFKFGLYAFLSTYLDAGDPVPSSASAQLSVTFSLVDTATGNEMIAPNLFGPLGGFSFGATRASNAPGSGNQNTFTFVDPNMSFSTLSLNSNTSYQLSARIQTLADARYVPEPATLALLGAGLIGLGARRKKTS